MKHLTEDDLVAHHYGEAPDPRGAADHLAACDACRTERDRLAADLALLDRMPVPERGEEYGRHLFARLRPRLEAPPKRPVFFAWRPLVLSASLAAVLGAAFLAGRFWPRRTAPDASLSADARSRILLYAVADHLDRSQIALLEFLHTDPGSPAAIERERRFAEELVADNRLYRQTAARAGEGAVAGVLEELERALLEIAHTSSPESREALRRLLESEGTLFKVRVVRSELGRREKAAAPPPAARS